MCTNHFEQMILIEWDVICFYGACIGCYRAILLSDVRLEKLCRRHKPQPLLFIWFFFFIQWIDATLFLHITFLLCNFSFPICIIHGYFLLQFSLFTFLFGLADHFIATNICFLFNWNSFQLIFANRCILCLNF